MTAFYDKLQVLTKPEATRLFNLLHAEYVRTQSIYQQHDGNSVG
eukprot:CAMPEP_0202720436 /NCGR_PEP_ID=MMETSP1385-20130828/140158_1 /ASSEMBLY_ACC=CAM_ASM_000861 /TAXON_ID=933848 /ORGANISM="Elphidium margaritaceum" /LENGTH=43 /DNA_ID= /DNA_START= /DNA_END= /DNA_ORIENTATION=